MSGGGSKVLLALEDARLFLISAAILRAVAPVLIGGFVPVAPS
jgi:hypothetical protein